MTSKLLKTTSQIKKYILQYNGMIWIKKTEKSKYFGTYSTYFIDNVPVLQHDMDNRTGKSKVYALIDFPKYSKIKALTI